jgi:hypothetical protein
MLGVSMIIIGAGLLVLGALSASSWIEAQTDSELFSLRFLSLVVAPLLGGALLVIIGLLEFF